MTGHLTYYLAQQLIADRLRVARDRQSASLVTAKNHERQRALVEASLLLSGRQDRPTDRRWA